MFSVKASEHAEWSENCLEDYSQFSDRTSECWMREMGDGTTGTWFYIPNYKLRPMQGVDYGGKDSNEWVIYAGTWGNHNSPGASYYTWAEIYDHDDPEDLKAYNDRKKELEDAPEWIEEESESEDPEEDEDDDDEDLALDDIDLDPVADD